MTNAVNARRKITEARKVTTEHVRQLLRDMNSREFDNLSQRHDAELTKTTGFDSFQIMLRQHEQERMELSKKQRNRIQVFKKTSSNSEQKDEQQRKYERLTAQLKMARITRMH